MRDWSGEGMPVTLSGSCALWGQGPVEQDDSMQVGGYRPQFRPHRGVIGTPGRNPCLVPAAFLVLAVLLIPAQEIHGPLRS